MIKELFDSNGAEFSKCGKYRFALWRIWDEEKPLIMFVGLNPSTANESTDDPTIRRVKRFAYDWGAGGVFMLNCFPYISTDPSALRDFGNTVENDYWLRTISEKCERIIFAWGSFDVVRELGRDTELKIMFPHAEALIINSNGSPRHPLYVKADIEPMRYE